MKLDETKAPALPVPLDHINGAFTFPYSTHSIFRRVSSGLALGFSNYIARGGPELNGLILAETRQALRPETKILARFSLCA